jgi:hypothetical protein
MLKIVQVMMVAAVAVVATGVTSQAKTNPAIPEAVRAWAADRIRANSEGINDEKTGLGKILRPTGVSIDAIKQNGIAGGRNSVIRKPFGK